MLRTLRPVAFLPFLGAFLASPEAWAGEKARLDLSRGSGAEACPTASALSDAVAARLGYEPFDPGAELRLTVRFRREGASLRASVEIKDADGSVKGDRTLTARGDDCQELAAATSFTVSILLDPHSGLGPRKPPREPLPEPPGPAPPSPPPLPIVLETRPPPPPLEAPTPRTPLRLRLVAYATGSVGLLPSPAVGVLAGAGLGWGRWSVELEVRADASGSKSVDGRNVSASFVGAGVVPCFRFGPARACGVVQVGALDVTVGEAGPGAQTSTVVLFGPRAGVSLPLASWLALDAHADALFVPTEVTARLDSSNVWSTPVVSGLLGLGAVGTFP